MKKIILLFFVAAGCFAGCRDIFEKDISHRTVPVIAPVDGVETTPGEITFLWQAVPFAEAYRLRVVSPNFAQAARVLADSLVPGTSYVLEMPEGEYQWSIQAWNFGYNGVQSIYSLRVAEPPEPEPEPDPDEEPGEEPETE